MENRFIGRVKFLQAISNEAKSNQRLKDHCDNFKEYWLNGFHPYVGKDIATSRPNPPEGHRHIHLYPAIFPNPTKGWLSSKACWEEWAENEDEDAQDINTNKHPTSDTFLCYLVDEDRTAYVFHYQVEDGHAFLKSDEYNQLVIKISDQIESSGQCIMGWQSHSELFELKWISKTELKK